MDLRFWNYVIPDGSTTQEQENEGIRQFWNYVIPDGSTTADSLGEQRDWFWNYVIPDGSTTRCGGVRISRCFGTMSFQMVLLPKKGL